jgi:site-specific DNA recombinase
MEKLDNLVAGHIEHRLLAPERLEEVLASMPDRRQERTERRREHIAELNKRAATACCTSLTELDFTIRLQL